MTSRELKKWIEEHYGRGQRLAFVTDYNAVAADMGDPPITLDALENWLYRQPPQGKRFEQTLDLVLAYREGEKEIVKVFTVNIPVTAERLQLIKEMGGDDGEYASDVFLRGLVSRALDREIDEYRAAISAPRKRRRGRPAKPILVTPELETGKPTPGVEMKPKPMRVTAKSRRNGRK